MTSSGHVAVGQRTEPEWLQLQSEIWEPAGRDLLREIGDGRGKHALDVGCGSLGWLRVLSDWVGPAGRVTGSDVESTLINSARGLMAAERREHVSVVRDDVFRSALPPQSFDLVHARFAVVPLSRIEEQLSAYLRLVRPGGWIVLEDNDIASWHFNPPAPAAERLIHLVAESFLAANETLNSGRQQPDLLRRAGLEPRIKATVLALEPGHPFLRLPLHFSLTLEPRLLKIASSDELDQLRVAAEEEIGHPTRWGTTFTVIQSWAQVP